MLREFISAVVLIIFSSQITVYPLETHPEQWNLQYFTDINALNRKYDTSTLSWSVYTNVLIVRELISEIILIKFPTKLIIWPPGLLFRPAESSAIWIFQYGVMA